METPPVTPPANAGTVPPVTPPANAGTTDNDLKPPVITQEKVQEIVNSTYTKAYAKASEESASKIQALETKILEMGKGSGSTSDLDGQSQKDLTLMKASNTEKDATIASLRGENLSAKISASLDGHDVFNRSQVISLVSGYVKYDENGKVAINSDSGVFINAEGAPGTLTEFVADYLGKNTNLVKATPNKGSGGGKPDTPKDLPSISEADFNLKSETEKREFLASGADIIKTV